ncbi:MAG: hypothetical protein IJW41_02605 [Oscillospiraceae bacterium]|nr:hypothetical protein [Oscillospiraceae bacterium]
MTQMKVQYIRYSTDGSAARKPLPAFAPWQAKAALKIFTQKRIRVYVDPVAILGIAVAVCMLVMMAVGMFRLQSVRQEAAELQSYVTQLSAENKALENEYEGGYDLQNVEQTALALGMVPSEEIQRISVTLPETQVQQMSFAQRIGNFLAGLFA